MTRVINGAVVGRHTDWLRARQVSPNTIRAREVALRALGAFVDGPILYATAQDLQGWQLEASQRLGAGTLRGYISHLREFYAWAVADQLIGEDPTRRMRPPTAPKYLPRPMSDEAFHEALSAAPDDIRLILALARWAGLRAMEIAGLSWQEVDLNARYIRVRGKGRKDRDVFVSTPLLEALTPVASSRGPVVRRRAGDGYLTPHRVSQMANEHLHELGVTSTLHTLRHAFLTALLEGSGGDLRLVQDVAGHSSPSTTAIYTKVRQSRMREAVERAMELQPEEAEEVPRRWRA